MRAGDDRGAVLVVALQAMAFVMAIGAALVLLATTETAIATNFRASSEAYFAAAAALERALVDLAEVPDWTTVLAGSSRAAWVDGGPTGTRRLADGTAVDPGALANLATCSKAARCTSGEAAALSADRPWGPNNPAWVPFAYGPLAAIASPAVVRSPYYVVVLVADDPSEDDANPTADGVAGTANPGRGLVCVRAEAFGPGGAHRAIEALVGRPRVVEAGVERYGARLRVLVQREVS